MSVNLGVSVGGGGVTDGTSVGGSGAIGVSWTPENISGLVTWLATLAASDTTLDGSNGVSLWIDRETGSDPGNFTQATAGSRPVRASGAEIVFDGTDDTLASGVNFSAAFADPAEWGVFCVVKILSNNTDADDAWLDNAIVKEVNDFWGLHINNLAAPYDLVGYAWDTSEHRAEVTGNAQDTWLVVQFWHDGTNIHLQVDGGTAAQAAAGGVDHEAATTLSICDGANIELRDLVLIDGVPSADDRESYLSWAQSAYSLV